RGRQRRALLRGIYCLHSAVGGRMKKGLLITRLSLVSSLLFVFRGPKPADTRFLLGGVYSEGQAKRGEGGDRKECAACDRAMLTGGESAPALTGGGFQANWNGLTLGDLFDRIRKTMLQSTPGKLTRQQNADVLAFMLSINKFPAGKAELYRQSEMLKEIRFETKKPAAKN